MRDKDLEALVRGDLGPLDDLETKPMFGGLAWMWHGNLLCGARDEGMLTRLGKGNDAWALDNPGVHRMVMGGRPMAGWVRLGRDFAEDQDLRRKLLEAAKTFVRTLPPK